MMTKHATRAPKAVDWSSLRSSRLTLDLSRRGLEDMTDDLAATRIYVALHEAAHFFVAVHDEVNVWDLQILGVRGKPALPGVNGRVRFDNPKNELLTHRFLIAGTLHEFLLLNEVTLPSVGDWFASLEPLVDYCMANDYSTDEFRELNHQACREVRQILRCNYELIYKLACAFITYSDANGHIDWDKSATLYKHARREINRSDEEVCDYGVALRFHRDKRHLCIAPKDKVDNVIAKNLGILQRNAKLVAFGR